MTAAGASAVEWARRLLKAAEHLTTGIEPRGHQGGAVQVATSMAIVDQRLPRSLAALQRHNLAALASLRVAISAAVVNLVGVGTAGGFIDKPPHRSTLAHASSATTS